MYAQQCVQPSRTNGHFTFLSHAETTFAFRAWPTPSEPMNPRRGGRGKMPLFYSVPEVLNRVGEPAAAVKLLLQLPLNCSLFTIHGSLS